MNKASWTYTRNSKKIKMMTTPWNTDIYICILWYPVCRVVDSIFIGSAFSEGSHPYPTQHSNLKYFLPKKMNFKVKDRDCNYIRSGTFFFLSGSGVSRGSEPGLARIRARIRNPGVVVRSVLLWTMVHQFPFPPTLPQYYVREEFKKSMLFFVCKKGYIS